MAATPAQMRAGIVTNLNVYASQLSAVQISAYRVGAPAANTLQIIGTDEVEYDQSFGRGIDYWTFQLQALAGSPEDENAQRQLDAWKHGTGTGSVKAGVESDRTLGGLVQDLTVQRASPDQIYTQHAATELLGCIFTIFVVNTGK